MVEWPVFARLFHWKPPQGGLCSGCSHPGIVATAKGAREDDMGIEESESGRKGRTTLSIVLVALCGCTLACCGLGALLLPPVIQQAREVERRQQATENLRQIGQALQNYRDTYPSRTAR